MFPSISPKQSFPDLESEVLAFWKANSIFRSRSIIVANIDNVMSGRFVPKEAQIDNSLMFLSVLSGVILFGVMSVLYGPLLTVIGIGITSVKMYMELKKK